MISVASQYSRPVTVPKAIFLWAILVFFAMEFYLPYLDVGPVPLANYFLLLFAFAGLVLLVSGRAIISKTYLWSFPPALLVLTLFSIVLAAMTAGINLAEWAKPITTKILIPLFLFILTYYLVRFLGVDTFIKILVAIAGLSGFVAVGQALSVDFFWRLRAVFGAEGQSEIADQLYNRPMGLSFYAIELCYELVLILPLACYLWAKHKHLLRGLLVLAIVAGILATRTYSAILAVLSMCALYLLLKKRYLLLGALGSLVLSGTLYVLSEEALVSKVMRESTYARWPEAVLASKVILHNPLGIGYENYHKHAQDHFGSIMQMRGYKVALSHTAHNQILNSGIYYGWIMMALTLYFYGRYVKRLWLQKNPLLQALFIAHVGYFVNSMFHNNGVLMGDRIYWHVIALTEFLLVSAPAKDVPTSS